jgi:hypothetical protein
VLATALSIHLLKTGEGLLHACISSFRWLKEKCKEETLEALSDWMVEEAEFLIRALETREGMVTKKTPKDRRTHRSFAAVNNGRERSCVCCNKIGHGVWSCTKFKDGNVRQRWTLAKERKLCYRCLSERYLGKDCHRTRVWGQEGCKSNHHQLLHESRTRDQKKKVNQEGEDKISQSPPSRSLQSVPDLKAANSSALEQPTGAEKKTYIATLGSSKSSKEYHFVQYLSG